MERGGIKNIKQRVILGQWVREDRSVVRILQLQNPRGCALISFVLSPSSREIYFHEPTDPVPLVFFMESANYVPREAGCYYAQSLIVTSRAIYRWKPLPFSIAFTDQVRIGRYLRTENMEELYLYIADPARSFAIVYSRGWPKSRGLVCSSINFSTVEHSR